MFYVMPFIQNRSKRCTPAAHPRTNNSSGSMYCTQQRKYCGLPSSFHLLPLLKLSLNSSPEASQAYVSSSAYLGKHLAVKMRAGWSRARVDSTPLPDGLAGPAATLPNLPYGSHSAFLYHLFFYAYWLCRCLCCPGIIKC